MSWRPTVSRTTSTNGSGRVVELPLQAGRGYACPMSERVVVASSSRSSPDRARPAGTRGVRALLPSTLITWINSPARTPTRAPWPRRRARRAEAPRAVVQLCAARMREASPVRTSTNSSGRAAGGAVDDPTCCRRDDHRHRGARRGRSAPSRRATIRRRGEIGERVGLDRARASRARGPGGSASRSRSAARTTSLAPPPSPRSAAASSRLRCLSRTERNLGGLICRACRRSVTLVGS